MPVALADIEFLFPFFCCCSTVYFLVVHWSVDCYISSGIPNKPNEGKPAV